MLKMIINGHSKFKLTLVFLHPLKASENHGFFMFSGGIEKDQGHELGSPAAEHSRTIALLVMT